MSKFVKIDIPNSNGQRATIIYKPSTGGTIYLGIQTLPFYYNNDSPFGIYEVQLQDSSTICTQIVTPPPTPTPTPTPTRFATPTPTPSATCDDTVVNPLDCEECTTYSLSNRRELRVTQYNDLTITTEYFGPTLAVEMLGSFPDDYRSCSGEVIPSGTTKLGYTPGFFEYKMYFNKPINDLKIVTTNGGMPYDPVIEQFDFTTNIGSPNLVMCGDSCGTSISGNSLFLNCLNPQNNSGNCGGGTVIVKSPFSYTAMTISGNGGGLGTYFGICLSAFTGCTDCSGNYNFIYNNLGKCEAIDLYNPTPSTYTIPVSRFGSNNYTTGGTEFYSLNPQSYFVLSGTSNNDLWSNNFPYSPVKGPLNRTAIKSSSINSNVTNRFYGVTVNLKCILSGFTDYYFSIGISAESRFRIGNDFSTFVDSSSNPIFTSNNINSKWIIFEFPRQVYLDNVDTIEFFGFNNESFGFEIYGNRFTELINATNINQINILKSSSDYSSVDVITEINETIISEGPTCPNGGKYNTCLQKCENNSIRCFESETNCDPCGLVGWPYDKKPIVKFGDVEVTYTYQSLDPLVGGPQIILPNCLVTSAPKRTVLFGIGPARPFTYKLYFSKLVNNLKLAFFGGGAVESPGLYEEYKIETNGGIPELSMCDQCHSYVSGNTVYTTHAGGDTFRNMGNGIFQVNSPFDFDELTLTGPGPIALAGTVWYFCVDPSQVPPPPTPKPPPPNVFGPNTYTSFMKFNIVGAPTPTPFPITVNTVYTRYNIY